MDRCFKDKGRYAASWDTTFFENCSCEQIELGVECSLFQTHTNTGPGTDRRKEYWHLNYVDLDKDGVNEAGIPEPEPVVVLEWWEYLYDNVGKGRCLDYG
jgi:hypothetical protein